MQSDWYPKPVCLKTGHNGKCGEITASTNHGWNLNALCVNLSVHITMKYNWLCRKMSLRLCCSSPFWVESKIRLWVQLTDTGGPSICEPLDLVPSLTHYISYGEKMPEESSMRKKAWGAHSWRGSPSGDSSEGKIGPQKFEAADHIASAAKKQRWMPTLCFLLPFLQSRIPPMDFRVGLPASVKQRQKLSHRCAPKFLSLVTLNPVESMINMNHHTL